MKKGTNNQSTVRVTPGAGLLPWTLYTCFAICLASGLGFAASLEAEYRKLPEIRVKPESGSSPSSRSISGGNQWKETAESPDYAPVTFSAEFIANGHVQATLAGVTITGENTDGNCYEYVEMSTNAVKLKLYQTYDFTLSGDEVFTARGFLSTTSIFDLFSSKTVGQQPGRFFNLYIWSPTRQEWEKLCDLNLPSWDLQLCQPMSASFKIQVRPDLGARPVTLPGVTPVSGEEQGDDAWTRTEPAIDAKTAPGDADPVNLSSAMLGDPATARFAWQASMGRLWSGAGAGWLRIDEGRISSNIYSPQVLNYAAPSVETNELLVLMDLDNTNCLEQVYAPQALATIDPIYGSPLLSTNDLLNVRLLVSQLTNHVGLLSGYLWTNFSAGGKQVLLDTNSSPPRLASTIVSELNPILQAGPLYNLTRFFGVRLMGKTKRLLLLNPSGGALIILNRFLLEDGYAGEIARLASTQFDVSFYVPSQVGPLDSLGFYTLVPGATSFVTWRIGLPTGATNQWQVQEIRNGTTSTTLLAWTPTAGCWTLTRGTGNEARIETRTIVSNVVAGVTNCLETQQVRDGAGVVSDRTAELYQRFDWGYELVAVTNDPGGANLVTRFAFNTDPNNEATYKKLALVTYPDGFWEQRIYSELTDVEAAPFGSLLRIIQAWKDGSTNDALHSNLVSDYAYDPYAAGSYGLQRWHGEEPEGSRFYGPDDYDPYLTRSSTVVYMEDTALYVDTCAEQEGLVTERRRLGNIEHYGVAQFTTSFTPYFGRLAGHIYSKKMDVGTLDAYDYEFGVWDPGSRSFTPYPQAGSDHDVRQTIFHGNADPWAAQMDQIYVGPSGGYIEPVYMQPYGATEEVRVIQGGNLIAKELYLYVGSGDFTLIDQIIYQRDCLGHATNVCRIDPATLQSRTIYQADWKCGQMWPNDLKSRETDQTGAVIAYTYDSLKRTKTRTQEPAVGQSELTTTFYYDAAGRVLTNCLSGGGLSQLRVTRFDLAGRLVQQINPDQLTTGYSYQNGGRQTTTTEPSGVATLATKYLDRRMASITGNAVTNQFFDYSLLGANTAGYLAPQNVTVVTLVTTGGRRWTASITDPRFEDAGSQQPAFGQTRVLFEEFGFLVGGVVGEVRNSSIDLDGIPSDPYDPWRGFGPESHYQYDGFGRRIGQASADPIYQPSWIIWNAASNERLTTWTNYYQPDGQGGFFQVSEQWSYPFHSDATPALVERTKQRITGFTSDGVSETQKFDADTNQTTVLVSADLANKKLTTITTVAQSSLSATQAVVNGLLQSESTTTVASPALYYYDALGRETGVRDSLGNFTQTRYDPITGQVASTVNAQGLTTTLEYYPPSGHAAGLLKSQTGPTGKKTYYDYNDRGQVTYTWGDAPYPEKREYNDFGDQITLSTYREGIGWSGSTWPAAPGTADVTHWYYDEATGLLTNKTDAAGQHVLFNYYNTHQLRTRVWARGAASTNIYRANGDFVRIDYSDGTSVRFTDDNHPYLNRLVKPDVIVDDAGTSLPAYDHAGRVVATVYTAGLLAGITVTNHLNPVYGRDLLQVYSGAQSIYSAAYGYDSYGRMGSVSSGVYSAEYGYVPNSDLLQSTTCKNNGAPVLTSTRAWDYGYRLRSIASVAGGAVVTSHNYLYDSLDRRIQATLEDGSVWKYIYNDRNELVGAHRYWPDWSPVSGQQYGYDYDNIGNRNSASSGGDTFGCNLRATWYTNNLLNQYTSITTPGFEDIIGVAVATNSVTVNSGTADRKGEYFHREISISNGSGPVWQNASVTSAGNTTNGGFAFPKNSQTLTYDSDGNLTFDGIWTYEWDPENRLAAMSMTNTLANLVNSNRLRLEFVYDYQGRRIGKTVKTWNGSAFANPVTTLFAYDGWNLAVQMSSPGSAFQAYMWGPDLSGSFDGAGGIGGLLAVFEISDRTISSSHFVGYDGNGNVTSLVRSVDLVGSARYDYSPYGETIRATGLAAGSNPFRFSTRFADAETGLYRYPHRFYDAVKGAWLNRDPEEEAGGNNLYVFVLNDPLCDYDALGCFGTIADTGMAVEEGVAMDFAAAGRAVSFLNTVKKTFEAYNTAQQLIYDIEKIHSAIEDGDPDEILMAGLQIAGDAFGSKLRGPKTFSRFGVVGQDHHIATDKAIKTGWTKLFQGVFGRNKMTLKDKENIIENLAGHNGRHSSKYHKLVWSKIKDCKTKDDLISALRSLRFMIEEDPAITQGNGI